MRTLTHDGQTLTIAHWAAKTGQSPAALRTRLYNGWSVAEALTTPKGSSGPARHSRNYRQHRGAKRKLVVDAMQIRREFNKLAADLNGALATFNSRLAWILKEDAPGVVDNFAQSPADRPSPSAQETTKLEFS